MKEGRFKAMPRKHGLTEFNGKDGPIRKMAIEFECMEGANAKQLITWFGGFKGKGEDYTLNAMMACGYEPPAKWNSAWKYKQVWITIEEETYQDKDGNDKKRMLVKYVNALDDEGPQSGALIEKHRATSAGADNFEEGIMASMLAKRAAAGMETNGGGTVQRPSSNGGTASGGESAGADDDIPF